MKISVLCVTRGEPHAERFLRHFALIAKFLGAEFVVGADRAPHVQSYGGKVVPVDCSACPMIETVLEEAVAACSGDWILRLDDDESVSLAMLHWMLTFDFSRGEAVAFPRAHLWGNEATAMTNPGYWPDWQMRLSLRKWAVRKVLHEPPAKTDIVAPACILHHVYLVRDVAARKECAERYCKIQGLPMPETQDSYWPSDVSTSPIFDGAAIIR